MEHPDTIGAVLGSPDESGLQVYKKAHLKSDGLFHFN
jgi:hypothetical protein